MAETDYEWDDVTEESEWNGRRCAYFARHLALPGHDPEAQCSFDCWDEPACITSEPSGGWPVLSLDGSEES